MTKPREKLNVIINQILRDERKYGKERSAEELASLEELYQRFRDESFSAQVHEAICDPSGKSEDCKDLRGLAAELLRNRKSLIEIWPWLTSGEADDGWRLGEALAAVDNQQILDSVLPVLGECGGDLRLLCAFVKVRIRDAGIAWLDGWLRRQVAELRLLVEITWRCGATAFTAHLLAAAIRSSAHDEDTVGPLAFGEWTRDIPMASCIEVIDALVSQRYFATALALVDDRMKAAQREYREWKELALELVCNPLLIRNLTSNHWKEFANGLVDGHAKEIASAIFREQADRSDDGWYIDRAEQVLEKCIEVDPSGVWAELEPYLSAKKQVDAFTTGFPEGVLDGMPLSLVAGWIAGNPEERATVVSRLVTLDFKDKKSLAHQLIQLFGGNKGVGNAFFSAYLDRGRVGPKSVHWSRIAADLEEVDLVVIPPEVKGVAREKAGTLYEIGLSSGSADLIAGDRLNKTA